MQQHDYVSCLFAFLIIAIFIFFVNHRDAFNVAPPDAPALLLTLRYGFSQSPSPRLPPLPLHGLPV
jgi:hypothetical protein